MRPLKSIKLSEVTNVDQMTEEHFKQINKKWISVCDGINKDTTWNHKFLCNLLCIPKCKGRFRIAETIFGNFNWLNHAWEVRTARKRYILEKFSKDEDVPKIWTNPSILAEPYTFMERFKLENPMERTTKYIWKRDFKLESYPNGDWEGY